MGKQNISYELNVVGCRNGLEYIERVNFGRLNRKKTKSEVIVGGTK